MRKKYESEHGSESNLLAIAVLNEAIVAPPGNKNAEAYLAGQTMLVSAEAANLNLDFEISEALSYLYAAEILQLPYADGGMFHERSFALAAKASDLMVDIRTVDELGGRRDARIAVAAIGEYAEGFV